MEGNNCRQKSTERKYEQTKCLVLMKMVNIVRIMMAVLNYSNKVDLKNPSPQVNFSMLLV